MNQNVENLEQAEVLNRAVSEAWIQTYTGGKFSYADPQPEQVKIEDIAGALSKAPRFSGHLSEPYSVAQHCLTVAYLVPPKHALQGLLHDASEAYLVDIPSPLKHMPEFAFYRTLEDKIQRMILRKFGVPEELAAEVKEADRQLLVTEANQLMLRTPTWTAGLQGIGGERKLQPRVAEDTEELFLQVFDILRNYGSFSPEWLRRELFHVWEGH